MILFFDTLTTFIRFITSVLNLPRKKKEVTKHTIDERDYCSICFDDSSLKIYVTPNSESFTFPIINFDWQFFDETVSEVKFIDKDLPDIWCVNLPAEALEINIEPLIESCLQPFILKGRSRFEAIESLKIECRYANGRYQRQAISPFLHQQLNKRLTEILIEQRAEQRQIFYQKISKVFISIILVLKGKNPLTRYDKWKTY